MALGNRFVPLRLSLIEEGELLEAVDEALADMQHRLTEYTQQWGEQAKGAKASLKLEVTLKVTNPTEAHVEVAGRLATSLPKRPVRVTSAFANRTDEGAYALFVRDSGSTAGDPTQMHLPTPDSRAAQAQKD